MNVHSPLKSKYSTAAAYPPAAGTKLFAFDPLRSISSCWISVKAVCWLL